MTATPPFTLDAHGCAIDALGHRVLVCSNFGSDCTARYSGPLIDANPAFECPICGRLGMRMEEMTRIAPSPAEWWDAGWLRCHHKWIGLHVEIPHSKFMKIVTRGSKPCIRLDDEIHAAQMLSKAP